jgi:hypothetical protein
MIDAIRSKLAAASPRSRLLVLLALIAVGATHCSPMSWNDESRMATIQSIVESHTLIIDHTDFASTGDKVFVDGHFYSDKPPMPALLGAGIYFPLYTLGVRLHGGPSAAYLLITLLTVGLAWILGTLAIFAALRFTDLDEEGRFLVSCALGFGSTFMTWSTTFNNHELAAGFLAIGFFFVLRARFDGKAIDLLWAGLFLSLAGVCDIPTGVFYPIFFVYALARRELRSKWLFYIFPLALTALPTALANYSIHHSIIPVQIYSEYFQYPGSPWNGSPDLSGIQTNAVAFTLRYALLTLVGPMGFLIYNPFLLIAIGYCVRNVPAKFRFHAESRCVLAGSALLVSYYWATTSNFSGWSYSIRWFVPLLPLFFFFLFPYLLGATARRRKVFTGGLAVSMVVAFVGALNPWSSLAYSNVPFAANIEQFVNHLQHPGQIYIKPRQSE